VRCELIPGEHAVSRLAEVADGLEPAEDLLDTFSDALAELVSGVACGPLVDLRAAVPGDLLRDVGRFDSP
jgi:hypothetical protein